MTDTTWILVPRVLYTFIVLGGCFVWSYWAYVAISNIIYKIKFKSWPKNPQEYKFFLLQEENKKLKEKIQLLEEENMRIFSSIINRLDQK